MREPWVDALRSLALLGVFIINTMGYPSAPNYPMPIGFPVPVDSIVATGLNGVLIALVQGKAYPLLCFLFGYSLCSMALQSKNNMGLAKSRLRLRYRKLLLIGVVHGAFVYFGDVLTLYAVCGLLAATWVSYRPTRLLRVFRNLTIGLVTVFFLYAVAAYGFWFDIDQTELDMTKDIANKLAEKDTLESYLRFNVKTYFSRALEALITLPIYLWLTVAGIVTYRFRLFSKRNFARTFWANHLNVWHFIAALSLNFTISFAIAYQQNADNLTKVLVFGLLSTPINLWTLAGLLAICMRHWHKTSHLPNWVYWLAPAGKHTLAMYLSLSVMLMLTSAVFLNIQGGTVFRFVAAVAAWMCAVLLAKFATKRGFRDPIAAWLSVKS